MFAKNRFADGGVVGAALTMDPTQPVKVSDTTSVYYKNFGGYCNGMKKMIMDLSNPLIPMQQKIRALLEQKKDVSHANDFIGNIEADYKFNFLPELHAHLNMGMESSYGKQDLQIDSTATSDYPYGRWGWDKINKSNKMLNFYLQYAKELDKHNFDLMGGYEWQHFYRDGENEYRGLRIIDSNADGVIDENDDYYNHITPNESRWATESYLVSFFVSVELFI
jgi:iron complex outermembrane receptor protein